MESELGTDTVVRHFMSSHGYNNDSLMKFTKKLFLFTFVLVSNYIKVFT